MEWKREDFTITDRREDLDMEAVHSFLRESYWAQGIPRGLLEKAVANSICFGVYRSAQQIGFGRVVTDLATFAYLSDIFMVQAYRGRGLGQWLVSCMLGYPELQGLRRWLLATRDAHGLYGKKGFAALRKPEWFMEINDPDIYLRNPGSTD
jgi:GNAT superfamily N-acetyltransferase